MLVGLTLSFLVGRFLDQVLGLGFLVAFVGIVLLGVATLRFGALPRWSGLLLIACLPLAINLGDHGGAIALSLTWLAVGYVLLLRCDLSALLQLSENSGQVSELVKTRGSSPPIRASNKEPVLSGDELGGDEGWHLSV